MFSLLRTSRYIWRIAHSRTYLSNRICKKNISPLYLTTVHNTRALQTSCHFFNETDAAYTETAVPPIQPAKNALNKLQQDLYKLDADVQRLGRITLAEVEKVFTSMKIIGKVSSIDGLTIIRCCGSFMPEVDAEQRTELVNDIWSALPLLDCNLDVSHYNALLKVHLENEHNFDPVSFLDTMEQQRIQPNRVTYQRLLAQFCHNGDINGASKILAFMKSQDLPLNEMIFNELITGHAKANNMEDAKKTLEVMRDAQLSVNSSTYSALARGYAFLGDIENVLQQIEEAESNNTSLHDKDILNIIYTLTVNGHGHFVQQVIPKLQYMSRYNQDCTNTILELVNRGYHEIGFTLLNTTSPALRENDSVAPKQMYFIKQILKKNVPSDVVIEYCKKLKESGNNDYGLLKATEAAYIHERIDDAIVFLKELHSQNQEIRPHFFWPIFIHKKGVEKDIYAILKLMVELDSLANFDTFIGYVFPFVNTSDLVSVINKLKDIGYEVNDVVSPFCLYLLLNNEMKKASELLKLFPVKVNSALVASRCLASAYMRLQDAESTMEILQHCNENQSNLSAHEESDVCGEFLIHLAQDKNFQMPGFLRMVKEIKNKDMNISPTALNIISKKLGSDCSETLASLLKSMVPEDDFRPNFEQKLSGNLSSIEDLEADLVRRKSKNYRTFEILHKLLVMHAKLKNLKRVEEILEELNATDFVFRANTYAVLLELYCEHEQLDQAMHYKRLLDLEFKNFRVDDHKIINLAQLLAVNKKYDDAENMIIDHHSKFGVHVPQKSIKWNVFRLLDTFISCEEGERVRKLFEMLHDFGYCKAENAILGPLVKAHFLRNDLPGAMEEFLRIVKTYKMTPWKNELLKHLIQIQDSENLQIVIDASISVHGEANITFDLAEAFVDCGQVQQAQKVLQTPGLTAKMDRVDTICESFVKEKKILELQAFVQITKDVFQMDKNRLYYQLLRAYVNAEDVENALGIWVTMQEENVHPSNRILHLLGTFLQSMNQPVPFEVPSSSYDPIDRYELPNKSTNRNPEQNKRNQGTDFLKSLETHVWRHKEEFPVKSLYFFLKDYPELLNRVLKMSDMYHQEGICRPRNVVWMYLMTNKRFEEADRILQRTPDMKTQLLFLDVIKHLREHNDIEISQKLLDVVRNLNLSKRSVGIAFSSHVNVLLSNKKLNEAVQILEEALKTVGMNYLNKGTLYRLKNHLVSANMTVPFTISPETSTYKRNSSIEEEILK